MGSFLLSRPLPKTFCYVVRALPPIYLQANGLEAKSQSYEQ